MQEVAQAVDTAFPANLARTSPYLTHEVFNRYHSEHEMLRYLHRLQARDLSLTTLHDSPRVLHDEAQCDRGNVAGDLARVCPPAPLRAG